MQYCQRDMTRRLSVLEKENSVLRSKLNQLETHSGKNNIKVLGLPNVADEACSSTLLKVYKSVGVNIGDNDIIEAHTIYSSVQPRPVIVKICNPKLKPLLFKHNKMLKSQHNISVQDDVPPDIFAVKKILLPIMHEAKRISSAEQRYNAKVRDDKLILNGSSYTLDKLNQLPSQLQLQNVFTKSRDDKIAFFSKHSPLSNHHLSPFTVEGIDFNTNEQFLMYSKAVFFNDELQAKQILDTQDLAIQKRLRSNIKSCNSAAWNKKRVSVMKRGLQAKLSQNAELKAFLLKTGYKTLIEANEHDTFWACGLPLRGESVWNISSWKGENQLGKLLMMLCGNLRN